MNPREMFETRSFRIRPSIWAEAMKVADARGETLSEVIRAALVAYVKKHGKELS